MSDYKPTEAQAELIAATQKTFINGVSIQEHLKRANTLLSAVNYLLETQDPDAAQDSAEVLSVARERMCYVIGYLEGKFSPEFLGVTIGNKGHNAWRLKDTIENS